MGSEATANGFLRTYSGILPMRAATVLPTGFRKRIQVQLKHLAVQFPPARFRTVLCQLQRCLLHVGPEQSVSHKEHTEVALPLFFNSESWCGQYNLHGGCICVDG